MVQTLLGRPNDPSHPTSPTCSPWRSPTWRGRRCGRPSRPPGGRCDRVPPGHAARPGGPGRPGRRGAHRGGRCGLSGGRAGGTMARLVKLGRRVLVHVDTHVREDAVILYGFATGTSAVLRGADRGPRRGPAVALDLVGPSSAALRRAVATDDLDALTLVPASAEDRGPPADGAEGPARHRSRPAGPGRRRPGRGDRRAGHPRSEVRAALAGFGDRHDEVREALAVLTRAAAASCSRWPSAAGRGSPAAAEVPRSRGRCGEPAAGAAGRRRPTRRRGRRPGRGGRGGRPAPAPAWRVRRPGAAQGAPRDRAGGGRRAGPGRRSPAVRWAALASARRPWRASWPPRWASDLHITSGARPGASRRPGRDPHQAGRGRRAVHRRDPPPAPRGRGDPVPGDGGLPARHRPRQGPARPFDPAHLPRFTLVGATTRTGTITGPLRDRFGLVARLDYYEPAELESIVAPVGRHPRRPHRRRRRPRDRPAGPGARRASPTDCCGGSATSPRCGATAPSTRDRAATASRVRRRRAGPRQGRPRHPAAICEQFGGGPVGLSTLAVSVGRSPRRSRTSTSPSSSSSGLLKRTPRGRVATAAAWRHLGLERRPVSATRRPLAESTRPVAGAE